MVSAYHGVGVTVVTALFPPSVTGAEPFHTRVSHIVGGGGVSAVMADAAAPGVKW